ncbi:MAG: sulfatase-like hydrolase/transferase [Trueperaceae bacterium]
MPPNILIFMTDHQRGDTVLPNHPAIMPNLHHFQTQSVTFNQAYCPSPHCCPSRASFFTGLYPSRHGVWNNVANAQALSSGPKPGVKLFSEDLRAAGYDLFYSGKWHVSSLESPKDRGWEELLVSCGPGTHHGKHWDDYKCGVSSSEKRGEGTLKRPGYGDCVLYGASRAGSHDHDERVVETTVQQLNKLKHSQGPWCLYGGVLAPHDPYIVPQKYLDLYPLENIELPKSYYDTMQDKPGLYRRLKETVYGQLSERETRETIRHFWAFCSYIDDMFGRVLEALERNGQADNTLVLFCADHGDYCGEHGLFAKGIPCFKGAYHVPAIVRYPKGITKPGRTVDAFVSLADFAPTFLELAGVKSQQRFSGESLVPFLKDESPKTWREAMFTQCNGVELYYTQRSVMTKDYKYVFNGFDNDELYDLNADPDEMYNLANHRGLESIKRALCQRLWQFAYAEDDTALLNPYVTVALMPYGPAEAFG